MELWFSETLGSIQGGWKVKQVLYHKPSRYQDVAVLDTEHFGRMLVLDGAVMTTEGDEFVYHEMLTHPGLLAHPNPKAVCVVGGGDGGTVREVLRHQSIQHVVLAEIDEDVIHVCREFFPKLAGMLNDPRVDIQVGDGAQYLTHHPGEFDAVISDSTDPVGPGVVLFEDPYFKAAKTALRAGGFFTTQCKSVWLDAEIVRSVRERLKSFFRRVNIYGATIPTYPSGSWTFIIASDEIDPRAQVDEARQRSVEAHSRYYTAAHQQAAFAMPAFLDHPERISL
jgi:spermidine synthase